MAKKSDEKDILLVRDEKTGELGVVGGLRSDGSPRTVPAKPEHSKDFMTFDRHGDLIDNFSRIFQTVQGSIPFRLLPDCGRPGGETAGSDEGASENPAANAELLSPHKVDTSGYEKTVTEEEKI